MNSILLIVITIYVVGGMTTVLLIALYDALRSKNLNHFLWGDPTEHDNEDYYGVGFIADLPLLFVVVILWPLLAIIYLIGYIEDITEHWKIYEKKSKKKKRK